MTSNSHDAPLSSGEMVPVDTTVNRGAPLPQLDLGTLLKFLQLDEDDQQRLHELQDQIGPCLGAYVDAFYAHLRQFEETERFFRDPALVERLKQLQKEHLRTMLEAQWDDDYASRRRRVGRAHADRGVKARFLLASYHLFLQQCVTQLIEQSPDGRPDVEHFRTLLKAVFLDLSLTIDEYIRQYTRDMRQALDLYWNVNQELKQFAQFSSHDLKTPLATVANLCEEVQDEYRDEIPPEAREMIESARQIVFRMCATIDELLSATISGQRLAIDKQLDSELPIRDAIERLRPALAEKNIQLTLPDRFPRVVANRIDLCEVFYNLLSNSVKYIEQTPGWIKIDVSPDQSWCTFSVKDNSPGIPPEEQVRIFAPFRRLAMHRDQPGTGLGLYFTRQLVEKQGGRIWVESEPGRGACFFVKLRRSADAANTAKQ